MSPGPAHIGHTDTGDALKNPWKALAPQSSPATGTALRGYGLALAATAASVAVTRFTWPLFAGTPFVPLFAAVAVTTHWGTGAAGLVAIVLAALGTTLAFPEGGPSAGDPRTMAVFVLVALFANRVIAGRNRIAAELRASEAELRASAADLRASWEQAKVTEQHLRRAQKMEAVGQLVAGVAHNFNNLLTVTMGYTDNLLDRHGEGDPERADLEEIRKATERGAALTRQLLAFGRKYNTRVVRVDLNRTVDGVREMLTRAIRDDIRLTFDVAAGPVAVLIDAHDLDQVIVNLVINARDALPAGGTINIDVAPEVVDAANSPADVPVRPGKYVRLRVRDNGTGMTEEVQSHLFEPFFTTKEIGEGTGLGLAFVHGIVQHAGGFVRVASALGKGTAVSVYLPAAPEAPIEAAAAAQPAVTLPGA